MDFTPLDIEIQFQGRLKLIKKQFVWAAAQARRQEDACAFLALKGDTERLIAMATKERDTGRKDLWEKTS